MARGARRRHAILTSHSSLRFTAAMDGIFFSIHLSVSPYREMGNVNLRMRLG